MKVVPPLLPVNRSGAGPGRRNHWRPTRRAAARVPRRPLHLYIISGVKVYHGPFKYRPACTIPSLSHRQLMGLSAPSASFAVGTSLLRQTKMLNDVLSYSTNIVKPALTAAFHYALYSVSGGRGRRSASRNREVWMHCETCWPEIVLNVHRRPHVELTRRRSRFCKRRKSSRKKHWFSFFYRFYPGSRSRRRGIGP